MNWLLARSDIRRGDAFAVAPAPTPARQPLVGRGRPLQREGEHAVAHLIAKRLFDHSELLGSLMMASRDFH